MDFVRRRPVTAVILDASALPGSGSEIPLAELRHSFPSIAAVLMARSGMDPSDLLRLGRAGIDGLVPVHFDEIDFTLPRALARALRRSTAALVAASVSRHVPAREAGAVRQALEGAQLGWTADRLASSVGLTRAHLSVRCRAVGLPSVGHLLGWAKMLHAARWLTDPGRSAESVSRQLEYSSGAAFRRALRNYTGATPTQIRERGGLPPVLEGFLAACDIVEPASEGRAVA
jgi:AraC-like DNA-binding protein